LVLWEKPIEAAHRVVGRRLLRIKKVQPPILGKLSKPRMRVERGGVHEAPVQGHEERRVGRRMRRDGYKSVQFSWVRAKVAKGLKGKEEREQ